MSSYNDSSVIITQTTVCMVIVLFSTFLHNLFKGLRQWMAPMLLTVPVTPLLNKN